MFGLRRKELTGSPLLAIGLPALTIATLTLGLVPSARADEPEPVAIYRPDALPTTSAKTKLFVAGGSLFALSYGAALGSSYLWETDPGASDLRIPIVGPWIKLGHTTMCADDDESCGDGWQVFGAIGAGFDGVFQAAALALLIDAVLLPTSSVPPAPVASAPSIDRPLLAPSGGWVRATPTLGNGLMGVTVFGAF